jgi:hypothetical protein
MSAVSTKTHYAVSSPGVVAGVASELAYEVVYAANG